MVIVHVVEERDGGRVGCGLPEGLDGLLHEVVRALVPAHDAGVQATFLDKALRQQCLALPRCAVEHHALRQLCAQRGADLGVGCDNFGT